MFRTPHVSDPVVVRDREEPGGEPWAAIIVRIHDPGPDGTVDLAVFPPGDGSGRHGLTSVPHADGAPAGSPAWDFAR